MNAMNYSRFWNHWPTPAISTSKISSPLPLLRYITFIQTHNLTFSVVSAEARYRSRGVHASDIQSHPGLDTPRRRKHSRVQSEKHAGSVVHFERTDSYRVWNMLRNQQLYVEEHLNQVSQIHHISSSSILFHVH